MSNTFTAAANLALPIAALSLTESPAITIISPPSGPSYDIDFTTSPSLTPLGLTFTRSGLGATLFDATGTLQTATTGTPRYDYGATPGGVTNRVRNSTMFGAIASDGVERTTNGSFALNPLNASQNVAQNGWSWQVAGTSTVTWSAGSVVLTGDGTNKAELDSNAAITTIVGTGYTVTVDVAGAGISVRAGTTLGATNTGTLTLNVGLQQVFSFIAATTTTFIGFSTTAASASTIANASVKSAGAIPNNWVIQSVPNGLTRTITLPIVNGIQCIAMNWSGTLTSTGSIQIVTDPGTQKAIPASNGQTWTSSMYVQVIRDDGNVTSLVHEIWQYDGNGTGFIATGSVVNLYSTRTVFQRSVNTYTLAGTGTSYLEQMLRWSATVASGTTINWTILLGAPQLELASSVGTFIATTNAAINVGATPLGLLIEESRTNSIRNPRAEGATIADGVERVTNGTFALNPINASQNTLQNGWQYTSPGTSTVTWSGTAAVVTGDGTNRAELDTTFTTVVGLTYTLSCDVTGAVVNLTIGTAVGNSTNFVGNTLTGTGQLFQFVATATTTWIGFGRTSASSSTIDNVSIKSAGKLPTNASINNGSGLVMSVVATGSDCGIPFMDLAFSGTTTSATTVFVTYESISIAASTGQTWTSSAYMRLVAGSIPALVGTFLEVREYNGSSALLIAEQSSAFTLTTTALSSQRYSFAQIMTQATTAFVRPTIAFNVATATAYAFTVRIGAPQLELGAFVTSAILPAIGTPAATTRSADVATTSVGGWFNPVTGTLLNEIMLPQITASIGDFPSFWSGSGNDLLAYMRAASGAVNAFEFAGNVNKGSTTVSGTAVAGTAFRAASTYNTATLIATANMNGGAVTSFSATAMPANITQLAYGLVRAAATGGYVRRTRYWSRALSNAEMISQTLLSPPSATGRPTASVVMREGVSVAAAPTLPRPIVSTPLTLALPPGVIMRPSVVVRINEGSTISVPVSLPRPVAAFQVKRGEFFSEVASVPRPVALFQVRRGEFFSVHPPSLARPTASVAAAQPIFGAIRDVLPRPVATAKGLRLFGSYLSVVRFGAERRSVRT